MVVFRDWIFSLFSQDIHVRDTNPVNGKGLFQRYIEIFGDEIDETIKDKIGDFPNLIKVLDTDAKYLVYLAEMMGNPPTMFYDDTKYRKFLRYFTDIVKCKGTKKSYELLFGILGCTIALEYIPLPVMKYDWMGSTGDEAPHILLKYDTGGLYDEECPTCSQYDLFITDPDGILNGVLTNPILYSLLSKLIKFVEPINLKLRNLLVNSDPVGGGDEWVLSTGIWDDGNYWNDLKIYKDTP